MGKTLEWKEIFNRSGMNQAQLAERIGVRSETLRRWIDGRARVPRHIAARIASVAAARDRNELCQ